MKKTTKAKIEKMTEAEKIDLFEKLQSDILAVKESIFEFRKHKITSQGEAIKYFRTIAPLSIEAVYCLFLNAKNAVIDFVEMGQGTLTQAVFYPREIIKHGLKVGASGLIVMHNHPSGEPEPSENDRSTTKKLYFAAKHMDMQVLDHIIIGGKEESFFSFHDAGLIEKFKLATAAMFEKADL